MEYKTEISYFFLNHHIAANSIPRYNIVTCQRIAWQRLEKYPAIRARNNRMNVHSSLLGNSAPMDWRDSYHVTYFRFGPRHAQC
jgi:hypothetical protein